MFLSLINANLLLELIGAFDLFIIPYIKYIDYVKVTLFVCNIFSNLYYHPDLYAR